MKVIKYSPNDFIANLKTNDFNEQLTLEGMIRLAEKEKEEILFNVGQKCGNWVSIPVSLIHEIEYLGMVGCHDHKHPLVKLHFNEAKNNSYAKVLLEMLQKMQSNMHSHHELPQEYFEQGNQPYFNGVNNAVARKPVDPTFCNCIEYKTVCVPRTRCHKIRNRQGGYTTICLETPYCVQYCAQQDCSGPGGDGDVLV